MSKCKADEISRKLLNIQNPVNIDFFGWGKRKSMYLLHRIFKNNGKSVFVHMIYNGPLTCAVHLLFTPLGYLGVEEQLKGKAC